MLKYIAGYIYFGLFINGGEDTCVIVVVISILSAQLKAFYISIVRKEKTSGCCSMVTTNFNFYGEVVRILCCGQVDTEKTEILFYTSSH